MELIFFIAVIAVDQLTKVWTNRALALGQSVSVWDGVFQFTNVHNTGAAWGMLAGGRILFLAFTPIFCAILIWFLLKYRKKMTKWGRICVTLLIAGAVGNFIDRLFLSYVRDMFDFCLINFPVFNVADSAITVGAIMLLIDTLFHKDNSLMDLLDKAPKDQNMPMAESVTADAPQQTVTDTEDVLASQESFPSAQENTAAEPPETEA